jgi:predicted RNA binding protein YcfA (HicA-like mRNA interferase family)
MRIPRDWSGEELVGKLNRIGYVATRQSGSHVRLTRVTEKGEQHITVPLHKPLRIGTLNAILGAVADHLQLSKDDLLRQMQ